jgi:hypothetical protein
LPFHKGTQIFVIPINAPFILMITAMSRLLMLCVCMIFLILSQTPLAFAAKIKNIKPIANAGSDQSTGLATPILLNGLNSSDSDGSIKRYLWQQTKGVKVKLNNAKTASASFVTPKQLKKNQSVTSLGFKLTITDDKNGKSSDSVMINVLNCAAPKQVQNGLCVMVCSSPQILENGVCVNPPLICQSPQILKRGRCVDPVICTLPQVLENGICVTPPPTCTLPEVLQNGICAVPSAPIRLNDTGIVHCSDTEHPRTHCGLRAYPGQDAEFGRDVLYNQNDDGKAGFSFTKLDHQGQALENSAPEWSCIKDNVTGLIWENKTADSGLHDHNKLYTQFSPSHDPQGKYAASDDAQGLVNAVNTEGWCGAHDWRLPTAHELLSLVDYGISFPGPVVEEDFFSYPKSSRYWTAAAHIRKTDEAWVVYFDDGRVFEESRQTKLPIRLVRTAPVEVNE